MKRWVRDPHALEPGIYQLEPDDDLDLSEDPGVYWGKPLSLDEVAALLMGGLSHGARHDPGHLPLQQLRQPDRSLRAPPRRSAPTAETRNGRPAIGGDPRDDRYAEPVGGGQASAGPRTR